MSFLGGDGSLELTGGKMDQVGGIAGLIYGFIQDHQKRRLAFEINKGIRDRLESVLRNNRQL